MTLTAFALLVTAPRPASPQERPRPESTTGAPTAAPLRESPSPTPLSEERRPLPSAAAGLTPTEEAELAALASEVRRHEAALVHGRARRDALAERVRRRPGEASLARLVAAWKRRQARAELEEVVAELQRRQAKLLELRARGDALLERSVERDWARLEALVAEAAAAWSEGRAGESAALEAAIAEAMDRAGAADRSLLVQRYRSLLESLVRVNEAIARLENDGSVGVSSEASPGGVGTSPGESTSQEAPPPSGDLGGASQFLGVAERGTGLSPPAEASLAAWTSLRESLVNEIIAVATEITRRAGRSS